MAIKLLGKAKPNSPMFTRGYTINMSPLNPPAPKKPTKPTKK